MSDEHQKPGVDRGRRLMLTWTTAVVGAVGAAFAAYPFLASWKPSAKARLFGGPVQADVGLLAPGELLKLQWRGQTIGVLRRTPDMIKNLDALREDLRDPDSEKLEQQPQYARNQNRALRPEFFVANIHCTHLGCVPQLIPEVGPQPFEPNWRGGFFCPCHKSKFDLAGRVYKGVPAQLNLKIPPYRFIDDDTVLIGVDPKGAAS